MARDEYSEEKQRVEMAIAYVFREESAKHVAQAHGLKAPTVIRHLRAFGVRIRSTHEQRRCDRRHGRFSQSDAIKAAWARGAFDTERYRNAARGAKPGSQRGEKNSFYGKHHTPETRTKLRQVAKTRAIAGTGTYGPDWTPEFRERIVARDDRRCLVCGARRSHLQVHHVDLDRRNNALSNLMTLCAPCHLAYHGRGELQFEIAEAHRKLLARLGTGRECSDEGCL